MPVAKFVQQVFGHFQNLNLLALLADLRGGRMAWQAWSSGLNLCPVAHGLPAGQHVNELNVLGQMADLDRGCAIAAGHLGADPATVYRFVRAWDDQVIGPQGLLRQLEEMWQERLADAETMQQILQEAQALDSWRCDDAQTGVFQELLA